LNGIEAIRELRRERNAVKAIVLTMNTDVVYAQRAFEAGASGYLLKSTVSGELVTAIREVLSGNTYVTPKIAGQLMSALVAPIDQPENPMSLLTKQQRKILFLVAEGQSAKQMAAKLGLARRTVETHKYRIMRIVGVQTTAELIRFALENDAPSKGSPRRPN
jgi:DNA-binding NarL/FixJ family response regulator